MAVPFSIPIQKSSNKSSKCRRKLVMRRAPATEAPKWDGERLPRGLVGYMIWAHGREITLARISGPEETGRRRTSTAPSKWPNTAPKDGPWRRPLKTVSFDGLPRQCLSTALETALQDDPSRRPLEIADYTIPPDGHSRRPLSTVSLEGPSIRLYSPRDGPSRRPLKTAPRGGHFRRPLSTVPFDGPSRRPPSTVPFDGPFKGSSRVLTIRTATARPLWRPLVRPLHGPSGWPLYTAL
jgi:hypothetical protein